MDPRQILTNLFQFAKNNQFRVKLENKLDFDPIISAIERKNIDFSEIISELSIIVNEIKNGNEESKNSIKSILKIIEAKENTDITSVLSSIYDKMCEEKIKKEEDYSSIIESQKHGFEEIVKVLTELSLNSKEKHKKETVNIDGEVKIAKPSWWKDNILEFKYLFPFETLEKLLEKVSKKTFKVSQNEPFDVTIKSVPKELTESLGKEIKKYISQIMPLSGYGNIFSFNQDGDLKVSSGIVNTNGSPINPATEETLQSIAAALGGGSYSVAIRESGVYTYIGKAAVGSSLGSAVWQIQRIDSTNGLDAKWADGNASFDNIFDNYASLSYS